MVSLIQKEHLYNYCGEYNLKTILTLNILLTLMIFRDEKNFNFVSNFLSHAGGKPCVLYCDTTGPGCSKQG